MPLANPALSQKFVQSGCPNCTFLDLTGRPDEVNEVTSANFNGVIALTKPGESWVAKWQRSRTSSRDCMRCRSWASCRAHVLDKLEDEGVAYVPRDGTKDEDVQKE